MSRLLNTTCPYCGVGCGVTAEVEGGQLIAVSGDAGHPANAGRLCVKGTTLAETLGSEGRLLRPRYRGRQLHWDAALDLVAQRIGSVRAQHGPGALGFYLSGQLLTEDYYVANKLMKGFLGSANVDTNSRLCMSSAVAGYKRAFGADLVPCSYADLETCDLLVMVGSNAAWTHPVIYQRIVAAKKRNPGKRVVVIDPRRTQSCDVADLHLQLRPGSDGFVFAGLLNYLRDQARFDQRYIERFTEGLDSALQAIADLDFDTIVSATGLERQALLDFYRWFSDTDQTVTLYSQGINQSVTGTDKCNVIINCHLATGRIGRPGTGPFSITGQPNAMGGREVGGLANQLAAHMDFAPPDIDRVRRFWRAPDMALEPGRKAVDMFQAAARGEIRFLWIMATNPAVSLPDTDMVRRALARCEFVVVSDCTAQTDTAERADLLLPAQAWGEKEGTVTNSERCISRQRKLVSAPGEARPDWWAVTQVARRLGFASEFDFDGPAAIFREHARLSGFENAGTRDFDISALANLSTQDYAQLQPATWPLPAAHASSAPLADGRFYTPSGRARCVPVHPALPATADAEKAGLLLNTGRVRDQWHSMSRTGRVPRLMQHRDFYSVSVSPEDAATYQLEEGDLVRLVNRHGHVTGLVHLDSGQRPGQVFSPIHWNDQFSAQACISRLIPAVTDPVSGQPQSKYAAVALEAVTVGCWGALFSRRQLTLPSALAYWSRIAVPGGYLTLLAAQKGPDAPRDMRAKLRQALAAVEASQLEYIDSVAGDYRELGLAQERLQYALFLHPDRQRLPPRNWLSALGQDLPSSGPVSLLAGASPGIEDTGRLVCTCCEVGEKTVAAAIQSGADCVEELGRRLRCGTQCGSCIPELKQLLALAAKDCAA